MPVILVGGGGEKSKDEICMLCSYDDRGKKIADWKGHTGCVLTLSLSPDGTMLATGGEDKFVRVWKVDAASLALHLQGHKPVQSMSPLKGHKAKVNSLSISPCGNFVASASADCSVLLWSLKKQSQVGRMEHDAEVNAVCFHGDDEVISCAGLLVLVWHRENCTMKTRLEGGGG
jgi:WD40 repeat protein